MWEKFKSTKGFSLTEVMIGIMILTIAIVSASNLLVSLVRTNRLNVQTLQAYYLAQEGVEAIRNIRDTNWLHNFDFKGGDAINSGVYKILEEGTYAVSLYSRGWTDSNKGIEGKINLSSIAPWEFIDGPSVDPENPVGNATNQVYALEVDEESIAPSFYTRASSTDDVDYYRRIEILNACENDKLMLEDDCEDFILVKSIVSWKDGSRDREIALETVLSNWKGGAL